MPHPEPGPKARRVRSRSGERFGISWKWGAAGVLGSERKGLRIQGWWDRAPVMFLPATFQRGQADSGLPGSLSLAREPAQDAVAQDAADFGALVIPFPDAPPDLLDPGRGFGGRGLN